MPIAVRIESSEKYQIDDDELSDDPGECPSAAARPDLAVVGFHLAVNFMRRFGKQKHAAADQDDVAPGYFYAENAKQGCREAHEPGQRGEHDHAEDERKGEANQTGAASLVLGEPGGEDRDENEIVDAEHDLERGQRHEGRPRIGVGQQR